MTAMTEQERKLLCNYIADFTQWLLNPTRFSKLLAEWLQKGEL